MGSCEPYGHPGKSCPSSAHEEAKLPPSLLATLSPVAHMVIIGMQVLHCTSHPLSHLISIPYLSSYLLAMLTPHCCLCSFISVLQEQRLFQPVQMAAAWQWHRDHYSAQLVSMCTLSPLIWISPLDFQMSKLPPALKLWGPWSPGELRAVLQVG